MFHGSKLVRSTKMLYFFQLKHIVSNVMTNAAAVQGDGNMPHQAPLAMEISRLPQGAQKGTPSRIGYLQYPPIH